MTPLALTEEYFQTIVAPHKKSVRADGGGHFAVWNHAERFASKREQNDTLPENKPVKDW